MAISESDYNHILSSYDEKRTRSARERDARIQEVYTFIPEVAEIDHQIESFGIRSMQTYLKLHEDPRVLIDRVRQEVGDLRSRKLFLLKRAGFPEDYMEPHYSCNLCQDTGFVDGRRCHCFDRELTRLRAQRSNLASSLETDNFEHFDLSLFSTEPLENGISPLENTARIREAVLKDIQALQQDGKPLNLLLTGSTGTGKTYFCSAIAKEVLDAGFSVYYLSAYELNRLMSENRYRYRTQDNDAGIEALDTLYSCDLLILDDLGTEAPNKTSAADVLYLIDTRIRSEKSTVISTNLTLQNISKLYSERLVSRLLGSYEILKFIGPDLRLQHLHMYE